MIYKRVVRTSIVVFLILILMGYAITIIKKGKDSPEVGHSDFYFSELAFGIYNNSLSEVYDSKLYRGSNQNDTIKLKQLAGDGILVIRFSGEACTVCIDFALEMVKKTFPDYRQNDRILFLASQIPERIKDKYYGKPVYSFTGEELNLPFEEYRIPYFFMLDSQMECNLFFIPELSQPRLTEFYLRTVKTRFFESQKPLS
jgi:hypothetical protein